VIFNFKIIFN